MDSTNAVPTILRNLFIVHFIVDILFAVPLFFFPQQFLLYFGWETIDVVSIRLVAAALCAIGIESWIGRNASIQSFRTMLRLKVIWSGVAVIGLLWSLTEVLMVSYLLWMIFFIFIIFHSIWLYWFVRLRLFIK